MSSNDFLSGLAIGAVAVGVPLVTVGVCAANRSQRDRKLVRDVVDGMRNDPQKMLKGVEIAKSLTNMAEFRAAAKELLREG